jgi:predicted ferric reductase
MRIFWPTLFWANWLIVVWYWVNGTTAMWGSASGVFIALGRLAGLSAAYLILLLFFLMGRMPWFERAYGLDKLARLHQTTGKWGILLFIIHPILLSIGYGLEAGLHPLTQLWSFIQHYPFVIWAALALVLFITTVGTSLVIIRSRLRYESWYYVHLLSYLSIFLVFWHQLANGHTVNSSRFFYAYWVTLYVIVLGSHLLLRFLRPLFLFWRHHFIVERVVPETTSSNSVYISGKKLTSFKIKSGQFLIVRFLRRGMWWQAHPFSLSKTPDGRELRITPKSLGDFTAEVKNIEPGTTVIIDGPYGIFTSSEEIGKVLCLAGGIGITPIRALIGEMLPQGKDVILLYANKSAYDIVFKAELEELARAHSNFKYSNIIGRIDEANLKQVVDLKEREVYLCGPVPMMDAMLSLLKQLGVPAKQIRCERFAL